MIGFTEDVSEWNFPVPFTLEPQSGGSKILRLHHLQYLKYVTTFWRSIAVQVGG